MAYGFGSQRSRWLAACQSDFYSFEIESTMGSLPTCHETNNNLGYRLHVLPPDAHTDHQILKEDDTRNNGCHQQ
jgi:hypothetical protein